jgi:hypothetical protein
MYPRAVRVSCRPFSGVIVAPGRGDHVEAEIFPWQTRPYDLVSPPTRVSFTAALMAPGSRGRFELRPDGPRLRVGP